MPVIIKFLFFFSLPSMTTIFGLITFGCRSFSDVGISIFVHRPISLCAGDFNWSDKGVLQYSKRAK